MLLVRVFALHSQIPRIKMRLLLRFADFLQPVTLSPLVHREHFHQDGNWARSAPASWQWLCCSFTEPKRRLARPMGTSFGVEDSGPESRKAFHPHSKMQRTAPSYLNASLAYQSLHLSRLRHRWPTRAPFDETAVANTCCEGMPAENLALFAGIFAAFSTLVVSLWLSSGSVGYPAAPGRSSHLAGRVSSDACRADASGGFYYGRSDCYSPPWGRPFSRMVTGDWQWPHFLID